MFMRAQNFSLKVGILAFTLITMVRCNSIVAPQGEDEGFQEENLDQKSDRLRDYYQKLKYQKSYYYQKLGDCEYLENPNDHNFHQEPGRVISTQLMDGEAQFKLKIYADCCQDFGIDYQIQGDTLFFFYEPIGTELCECKCLYSYKLRLKESLKESVRYRIKKRP